METGTQAKPVTLSQTKEWIMQSRFNGLHYRISVYCPAEKPPAEGFPIIYTLDGNATFVMASEMIRIQSVRREKTGVVPAIVVSIGYDINDPFPPRRHYDLTMPAPASELPEMPGGRSRPEQGGAMEFMSYIEEQLKSEIEQLYPVDTSKQMIIGHSLGGLFVLNMLFTRPGTFHTYIAGSPSIHWNPSYMAEQEKAWIKALQDGEQDPLDVRVLVAVGELEGNFKIPMINNARAQAERLSALSEFGVHTVYKEFEGENHSSILPVLINRALRFNGWANNNQ
ncbi:alpha/beta hydrolase-fold protein [Neobacillus mesonae]|nr:alpha/beta hydrolase-fold protein [Neobacillus mesonae]